MKVTVVALFYGKAHMKKL